ncbi:MAG: GNAT family N-acetyltransferase [Armatimonadota bacterium]|nr:MAG: GNAT family N-acetyltransferase [Armatimonadota bacterium]
MEIRRLSKGEERAACEIAALFRSSQVGAEYMAALLADERNHLIAALVDERPVGYALGYELQRVDGRGPMMLLYEIEVVESHRRRGIGRALVERLKRICKDRGFAKMFVFTEESNSAATALYACTGGERGALDTVTFWYPGERL